MSADQGSPDDHVADSPAAAASDPRQEQDVPLKRKASSSALADGDAPTSPKRAKVDDTAAKNGSDLSPRDTKQQNTDDRRQNASQEERKRGKRLFGGLLSTLSQTTNSSQQKKRQEIERRQQAKVHQQRAEDDKHREVKLAKLKQVRQVEQIKFEEQVMKTRHSNLLAKARFLRTRCEPAIHFLPWEPTERQEDAIKDQIQDAEEIMEKELREFAQRKEERMRALGIASKPSTTEVEEPVGKPDIDPSADLEPPTATNRTSPHTNKVGPTKDADEMGDVMVEEEEDTVIY